MLGGGAQSPAALLVVSMCPDLLIRGAAAATHCSRALGHIWQGI